MTNAMFDLILFYSIKIVNAKIWLHTLTSLESSYFQSLLTQPLPCNVLLTLDNYFKKVYSINDFNNGGLYIMSRLFDEIRFNFIPDREFASKVARSKIVSFNNTSKVIVENGNPAFVVEVLIRMES